MLTAFLLRAKRVLVLTPSRLVRNQIADEFETLRTLKETTCFPTDGPTPVVREVESKLTSAQDWESLRDVDVVIATPNSISPSFAEVPRPPDDLFDLVLVDEAHHSPAKTWNELLESFSGAAKTLFTATPFRRDNREIRGRFVYSFPLKEAFKDGIFGRIRFLPVTEIDASNDISLAKKAEAIFREDRAVGLRHLLMVRTDSKKRARELADIYSKETSLRLQTIHSGHSYKHIKRTVNKLRRDELDGVICVDMLGEGFNLPELKIAAIHAPHKSLEVTLQFIGRFARTGAEGIGEAKFIAVPSEIEIETSQMYVEGAVWQDLVADLSETRIQEEEQVRETLESFEEPTLTDFTTDDLSLYSLRPFSHVKIFRLTGPIDIHADITLSEPFELIFQQVSAEQSAVVLIARECRKPKWSELEQFYDTKHELFLVYFDEQSSLLFINASRKSEAIYDSIASQYSDADYSGLPLSTVDRVLRDLGDPSFFNIGMKNRILSNHAESYRIISGTKADVAVTETDGNLYDRGHVFGRGETPEGPVTIGYSSLSKVWSNKPLQIPQSIDWCRALAQKIVNDTPVRTGSGLDHLAVGHCITQLPTDVIAADWDEGTYKAIPNVTFTDFNDRQITKEILDLELVINVDDSTPKELTFSVVGLGLQYDLKFVLEPRPRFSLVGEDNHQPTVGYAQRQLLVDYLNDNPLHFFCADMSRFHGNQLFLARHGDITPFAVDRIASIDWVANDVDIEVEFGDPQNGKISIHDHLKTTLNSNEFDAVLYDHRTGEIADVITLTESDDENIVRLYHCKGSGGPTPGNRIGDVYEVCGQVVKSLKWTANKAFLLDKLRRRIEGGSVMVRGTPERITEILSSDSKPIRFQIALVQPGLSKANLSGDAGLVLAAAADYLRRSKGEELIVLASP